MKIIDERHLFEVTLNGRAYTVLALSLVEAIKEVISWNSISDEDDQVSGFLIPDNEVEELKMYYEDDAIDLSVIDFIKDNIKPSKTPSIVTREDD
ncbi:MULTISPECIES: hypothetical protein [Sphingobacterium]|uniref:hypothetical protein n=1 Tax=Sphingobacterium TaxID=28453 RepID=UPI00257ECE83|nr:MULTISPECIES: hypothetical protein [Sphingobacterium]